MLRSCMTAGLTCSQIAAQIGVSRNAVIGKIHRLGLSPGRRPAAPAQPKRTAPMRGRRPPTRITRILRAFADAGQTVVPFPSAVEEPLIDNALRCSLLDLEGGRCRWPLSDPGKADFGFCGHEAIAGISYCVGHARIAYRLPSGRRA
jgi:GcrA cell cycle regulator